MDFKTIALKLIKNRESSEDRPSRLSADEMELAYFKERERKDNIRKELDLYRKQESSDLLTGATLLKDGNRKGSILDSKNVMMSRKRLL